MSMAEPWIGLSAYIEMDERHLVDMPPMCGKRSLTYLPHWPYCLNSHLGPTTRPSLRLPPRPKVLIGWFCRRADRASACNQSVDVTRTAVTEDEDDALRLGRNHGAFGAMGFTK